MRIFGIVRLALLICMAALFAPAAVAQVAPPVAAATAGHGATTSATEYVIGPEDTIEVEVVGQPDRTRVRVYTDGTIQMNLIGRVSVAGLTPRQASTEIAAKLKSGGFYANPVVNVEVTGFSSRYVTVLGAVNSPGLVPINREYHLSEILARVGGVREIAADYLIVRSENGPEKRYSIDKLAAGDAKDDPLVAAGDKIFSPQAEVFYIQGEVKSPGSYPLKTSMTIAQAIARGGGLTESGSGGRVKVNRGGKTIKLEPTELVQPGDVLTIPERLF